MKTYRIVHGYYYGPTQTYYPAGSLITLPDDVPASKTWKEEVPEEVGAALAPLPEEPTTLHEAQTTRKGRRVSDSAVI
jgi:hypothetical protein